MGVSGLGAGHGCWDIPDEPQDEPVGEPPIMKVRADDPVPAPPGFPPGGPIMKVRADDPLPEKEPPILKTRVDDPTQPRLPPDILKVRADDPDSAIV